MRIGHGVIDKGYAQPKGSGLISRAGLRTLPARRDDARHLNFLEDEQMDVLANVIMQILIDSLFPRDEKEHGPQSDYALCN